MKILIKILVLILRILIAIGDSVLFLIKLPIRLITGIFSILGIFLTNLGKTSQYFKKFTFIYRYPLNEATGFLSFVLKIIYVFLKYSFFILFKIVKTCILGIKNIIYNTSYYLIKILQKLIYAITEFLRFLASPFFGIKNIFLARPKRNHSYINLKVRQNKIISFYPLPFRIKFKYFFYGFLFSFVFIFLPMLFAIFLQNLPNPKNMIDQQIPQTTKIYDRNHILLYQIYATQNRTLVPLSEIPQHLKDATIAIEDKNFYNHVGFDVLAIARSLRENLSGDDFQGGSTITQQLIKTALLSPEPTISRKVKEIILAFWAERIYNKNQILEMYFNQVPYGGTAWGVEAASEVYFGKKVKDLNLAESAFLAGIPRAPTIYSPFGTSPHLWKKRQREVLRRMQDQGYITRSQAILAEKEELAFQQPQTPIYAPHFVMYVKDFLVKKYGLPMVEKGGLNVVTSLDLKLQDAAQKIVSDEVNSNINLHLTNGAALITNPTNGDILAMVGSKDFSDPESGNVNLTTSLRQPGSSVKPITYSAALSHGFTAATILDDSPIVYTYANGAPSYAPVNYDGKFHGKVPLRLALGNSFNIPAVKLLNQIGVPTLIDYGKRMGIKTWNEPQKYGLALTLGGAEVTMTDMATVFGVFANQGVRVDVNPIVKVTNYKNEVLEEKRGMIGKRVLEEGVAFIISDILADNSARVLEFGPNSPLNIPGRTVSVKTGTSDNKRDNWTIGYTPSYVVAVWVGNNDNSPMSQALASGITGAAPIWNKIMRLLLDKTNDVKAIIPINVIQKSCLGRNEYFIKGTENTVNCVYVPPPSITPTPNL